MAIYTRTSAVPKKLKTRLTPVATAAARMLLTHTVLYVLDGHTVHVFVEYLSPGAAGARLGRPHFPPSRPSEKHGQMGSVSQSVRIHRLSITQKGGGDLGRQIILLGPGDELRK